MTSDFDTIRAVLMQTSSWNTHDALAALSRVQAASEQAEKILAADEVCACLDETGGRQVRMFERCERCHALMESDLPGQLAEQSEGADEWREQWEKAEQRAELAERVAKDAAMKERAMTDYFADASRRADEWRQRAERAEREMISEAEAATNYARRVVALEARAERAERERNEERALKLAAYHRLDLTEARAERERAEYLITSPTGEGLAELAKARRGEGLESEEILPALRAAMEVADRAKERGQATEARVTELAQLLVEWRSGLVSSGGYGGGLKQRTDVALASHDQKEGEA